MPGKITIRNICGALVLLLPVVLAFTLSNFGLQKAIVHNGVADFQNGIDSSQIYELNGDWQYFPDVNEALKLDSQGEYINVPGDWTRASTLRKPLPAFAAIAYKLTILMPKKHSKQMAIVTDVIRSANEVYVNGKLMGSEGVAASEIGQFIANNKPRRYEFPASDKIEIVIKVANFINTSSAGIITPMEFGSAKAVGADGRISILADGFVVASFFLALLIFIGMYFQQIYQRELLYFSLYCFCSTFTFALKNERIFFDVFPSVSFNLGVRIDFVATLAAFFFIMLYANAALKRPTDNVVKILSGLGVFGIFFGLLAPVTALMYVGQMLFVFVSVFVIFLMIVLIIAIRSHVDGRRYLLFGLICFFVLVVLMAGNFLGVINDVQAIAVVMPLFLASQLLFINERHNKSYVRKRMEAAELAYLRAQVNPHFIYNMLGTISCLVEDAPRVAQDALVDFSSYLRKLLKPSAEGVIASVRDELELAEYYLRLEKMRFGERLKVVVDVEDSIMDFQLPQLSLQPLVENAVKYGLLASSEGGKITIAGRLINGRAYIEIADTGQGMSREKLAELIAMQSKGIGLQNTRERVLRYGGEFTIKSDRNGTRIEIVTKE
ncbi:MAG: histidine kinase [Negativicutes bacterium]|jgi:sensor histidine kinase YesM